MHALFEVSVLFGSLFGNKVETLLNLCYAVFLAEKLVFVDDLFDFDSSYNDLLNVRDFCFDQLLDFFNENLMLRNIFICQRLAFKLRVVHQKVMVHFFLKQIEALSNDPEKLLFIRTQLFLQFFNIFGDLVQKNISEVVLVVSSLLLSRFRFLLFSRRFFEKQKLLFLCSNELLLLSGELSLVLELLLKSQHIVCQRLFLVPQLFQVLFHFRCIGILCFFVLLSDFSRQSLSHELLNMRFLLLILFVEIFVLLDNRVLLHV